MDKKNIFTHAGQAHMDEFMCIALLSLLFPFTRWSVHRCTDIDWDTKEGVLDGARIPIRVCDYVVDIGGLHRSECGWFDHHQLGRNAEPACSFSMMMSHFGPRVNNSFGFDVAILDKWVRRIATIDSKGPFYYMASLEIPKEKQSSALAGILGDSIAAWISNLVKVGDLHGAIYFATEYLRSKFLEAASLQERFNHFDRECHVVMDGAGFVFPEKDIFGLQEWIEYREYNFVFSISRDDRGNGWTCYRYNDNASIDLSMLASNPDCVFTHAGGFICKWKDNLDSLKKAVQAILK